MFDWIPGLVFAALWLGWNYWRQRTLEKEFDQNNKIEPPDTHQLKWDMRHIREDMNMLCNLMFFAVFLLAIIAYKVGK